MEDNKIIKSFKLQNGLNQKIWNKSFGTASEKIKPKVREKLLEIAYEFIQYLNIDVIISDVHLTGSLANYNWSEYSDFDLHVIADFKQFPESQLELYKELFTLKKTLFNSEHNIKLFNYDVELYVQDENEKHTSSGVYSLIKNKWLEKPRKESFKINQSILKSKTNQWTEKIDKVLESANEEKDLSKSKKIVDDLKDKLKKYRKIGLDKGGEMSYENLVFKYLRRSGHIEKLFNYKKERINKELSIKESASELRSTLDDLGYKEKGSEISNGGEITSEISKAVSQILINFKQVNPTAQVKVTGGNDTYHKGTNSKHNKGLAVDLTVEPSSARNQFITILNDYKKINSDFLYIDEYTNPSKRATAGHFHLQLGKGSNVSSEPGVQTNKLNDLITKAQKSTFLETIKTAAESNNEFAYEKVNGKKIPYISEVEKIQIALQFLGYSLPKWGVDGLFGPETKKAVERFQEDNDLEKNGVLSSYDLKYLYALLIQSNFSDTDLSKIQTKSDFNNINIGNDKQFYEEILKGIDAPITDENLKFLYAWRQAEGAKATNNPFNTTFSLNADLNKTNYNKAGVKNYSTPRYGVEATLKTLLNGRYGCIVDGLKNDIGADKISKCSSLATWGTGSGITSVLSGSKINPPQIYT